MRSVGPPRPFRSPLSLCGASTGVCGEAGFFRRAIPFTMGGLSGLPPPLCTCGCEGGWAGTLGPGLGTLAGGLPAALLPVPCATTFAKVTVPIAGVAGAAGAGVALLAATGGAAPSAAGAFSRVEDSGWVVAGFAPPALVLPAAHCLSFAPLPLM